MDPIWKHTWQYPPGFTISLNRMVQTRHCEHAAWSNEGCSPNLPILMDFALFRDSIGANKSGDLSVSFVFCMGLLGGLWFIIGFNWLIKAWGHIPILFNIFGTFKMFSKSGPHGPLIYYQHIPTHTRTVPNSF